jgi:hypothetical protein
MIDTQVFAEHRRLLFDVAIESLGTTPGTAGYNTGSLPCPARPQATPGPHLAPGPHLDTGPKPGSTDLMLDRGRIAIPIDGC